MAINSYKKRLKKLEFEESAGTMLITIVEALTLTNMEIGNMYVGKEWVCEVFDTTTAYSSGIALSAPFRMSGSSLDNNIVPQVFISSALFPVDGYTFHNSPENIVAYYQCKAIDQTTALDAAKQYRYDSGSQNLRLTGLASASEITAIGDILSAGQYLVVIHRVPVANMNYVLVT